jgi:NAD-dependent protein deacetylase/lipoamidase
MKIPDEIIKKIKEAERIVFFTGAGISAESGIPVFRGKDGIWNKLKPEELANFNYFMKNPELVWEWYQHRKKIVSESKPNVGHLAIMEMEKYVPDVKVITQNIDNLHKRAGSKIVYELHGNIERNYCVKCKKVYQDDIPLEGKVPKCSCGGLIRPDVVWFGEYLPQDQFDASYKAAENSDLFFIIGTSAIVYPAASLIYTAKESGAALIEINIEKTEVTGVVHFSLFGKSGGILSSILEIVRNK